MQKSFFSGTLTMLVFLLIVGCEKSNHGEHDDHNESSKIPHSGESEKLHQAHADETGVHNEEEGEIEIAPEFITMAGITLEKTAVGRIKRSIDVSGEIGFNEDRLVHIAPRFPGIVNDVNYKVGEFVEAGTVVATIESDQSMTPYTLKAPISGTIIEKHAVPGEHVSEEESIYLLGDLTTVWVHLAIHPNDAVNVKPGQKVTVSEMSSGYSATGTITYLSPVMDAPTRRIIARMILPNSNNRWRPGSFVKARIETGEGEPGLIIDKEAVQFLNNRHVVFVQHEPNRFKPVDVVIGTSDSRNILILGGLEQGVKYVKNGAFELKAKMVTGSLGAHAGHGH